MRNVKLGEFIGEFFGTFLLVLFGCGSVAVTQLFGSHQGLFQIAIVWGLGVTLAIYINRTICCAHFNPAVTFAMAASGRMAWKKVPRYLIAQFIGAFAGGMSIYGLFGSSIEAYEKTHDIVRGTFDSVYTAKMFGEYYVQPGDMGSVGMPLAIAGELFGTFLLVLFIFALTENCNVGRPNDNTAPIFIGLTVSAIICLIAPLTQAGLNPARDLGPRIVAMIFGWGEWAFPDKSGGFIFVYVLAPIIGGLIAGLLFTKVIEPIVRKAEKEKVESDCCCCK